MAFCFEPHQVIRANGRWYQVASVRIGAVGQCNVIGLYSISEHGHCAVDHVGEMFTPEDVLLEVVKRGCPLYQRIAEFDD
jgi:hypothetical protein